MYLGELYNKSSRVNKISEMLISLHISLEEPEFIEAVNGWFLNQDYKKLEEMHPSGSTTKALTILQSQLNWINQFNIEKTPTLFFNNKELSNQYSIEQLVNFI